MIFKFVAASEELAWVLIIFCEELASKVKILQVPEATLTISLPL